MTSQFGEMGFKLNDLAGVQSGNAHAVASSLGVGHANQASLAASRTNLITSLVMRLVLGLTTHSKGVSGCGESSDTPPGEHGGSTASLKCLYTNAQSWGNKQELQIYAWSESHNLTAVSETWWDSSPLECCNLFLCAF